MDPTPSSSVYRGLARARKEIRLLSISPSNSSDAIIECFTQTFELDKAPPFDALSYVWGDPDLTAEIRFCGTDWLVTTNLFAALERIRARGDSKWIWVDALSINQTDTVEKNYQVPLMRHIYQRAERVLSWIGEADEDTPLAFLLIERWAYAILATSPNLQTWPNGEAMRAAVSTIHQPFDEESWAAIGSFFRKTYWERIWIVQEVSLARNCILICGKYELNLSYLLWSYRTWISGDLRLPRLDQLLRSETYGTKLYGFMMFILEQEDAGAGVPRGQPKWKRTSRRGIARLPFLLKRASALSATDARDKVYGVLGLLDVENLPIPVDYGNTVEEAYTKAVWSLINQSGCLDVLAFAGNGSSNNTPSLSLPSWVPDCRTHTFELRFCEDTPFYDVLFFNASLGSTAVCSLASEDMRQIRVSGLLCDEIAVLAAQGGDPNDRFHRWLGFVLTHRDSINAYQAPLSQVLFRTMAADELWRGIETPDFLASHLEYEFSRKGAAFMQAAKLAYDGVPLPDSNQDVKAKAEMCYDQEIRERLSAWFQHPDQQIEDRDHTQAEHPAKVENYVKHEGSSNSFRWPPALECTPEARQASLLEFQFILRWTDSRCLFITKSGYIGVGPGKAKEGDKIFIPLGCCTPLIIRWTEAESFELIGDTYVCGMMQGEMMEKLKDNVINLVDLVLC